MGLYLWSYLFLQLYSCSCVDAAFAPPRADDYKRKRNKASGGFSISHQFCSGWDVGGGVEDNDCVLIRKQTGCGRAGTGEGEAPWTRRDRGASVKRSREAAVCSLWRMVYDTRTEPVTRHNHSVLTHHSASPDCSCSTPGYWPAFISQTANRMTASFQRRSCTRILFPTWPVIFDRSEGQTFTLNI